MDADLKSAGFIAAGIVVGEVVIYGAKKLGGAIVTSLAKVKAEKPEGKKAKKAA